VIFESIDWLFEFCKSFVGGKLFVVFEIFFEKIFWRKFFEKKIMDG
jgi:hypothetical protein